MAFTLISNTSAGSSNTTDVTTGAIDTTGANILIAVATSNSVVTDSKSNTWTKLTVRNDTGGHGNECAIYYAKNPTVGSGHTFTATGGFPSIAVASFSGADTTSPFDQENGTGSAGSVTSIQTGSVTPTQNNELLIAGLTFDVSNTPSINSSFTITNTTDYSGGNHYGVSMAYKIQTSLSAENPTWSWGAGAFVATAIATFKIPTSGGGGFLLNFV